MPLMQLNTDVLPAPFGPISASSSPRSTLSETPSSTTRPPKRSVSLSISSSAIPPPAAAILLDVAIATPRSAARLSEIEFLDVAMAFELFAGAVQHHAAIFQHVAIIGDVQRDGRALLDDDDGDAQLFAD